ncbi:hypothetical protein [Bradyrhizobium sp. CCBAU 45389]|uniref:hypothetical protein n=1 Tax=Bradyrhizobium sp. CCBAU 45389 TaxID=858429 RepID=UPI002306892D|nr:hypothetical protein [Bradyrhizobium sp. CCBAU 45389]
MLSIDPEAGFFAERYRKSDFAMSIPTSRANCRAGNDHLNARRLSRCLMVSMSCAACLVQFASTASAQCAPRNVLRNQLTFKMHSAQASRQPIKSARDVATWKTIAIGGFANPIRLRNELHGMGCNVGGQAAEILARPAFTVSSQKTEVELVVVSPVQLGFTSDTATLADVYARAREFGFELVAAEVGPQLRIQYLDQPMGEFLIIAMEPIKTWSGEPIILNVANGGAGLILIGQDGRAEAGIPTTSRFVFARSRRSLSTTEVVKQVAARLPP